MHNKQDKTRKYIKRVLSLAKYAIAAFIIFLAALQTFAPSSALRVFGFRTFLISDTGSMLPYLNTHDFIVVQRYDFCSLKEGDCITFYAEISQGGKKSVQAVTHKIIASQTDADGSLLYRTKGINNSAPDTLWISESGKAGTYEYIGKMAFKVPFLGQFAAFLRSPFGIVSIIADAAAIAAVVILLKSYKKESAKNR